MIFNQAPVGAYDEMEYRQMDPENLAAWYFRLNGFFTIPNFVLHPMRRGSALTDADIAGVRFPYRAEFPEGLGGDDLEFRRIVKCPYAVFAEVKKGECRLNGPWSNQQQGNMDRILSDLGLCPSDDIPAVADSLYNAGRFSNESLYCSLFCIGNSASDSVAEDYPDVPQKTWDKVSEFVFQRFKIYRQRKTDHSHWDYVGKTLWECFESSRNSQEEFENSLRRSFNLPTT